MPSIVVNGGRVIDPESGTDTVANVRIHDGVIAEITNADLTGGTVIDATGKVVAPGFVDLHVHAFDDLAQSLMVRNGVTTALELELGSADVNGFVEQLAGQSLLHFGCSAGYGYLRTFVQTGIRHTRFDQNLAAETAERIEALARKSIDAAATTNVHSLIREQVATGAIGVGLGLEYSQGTDQVEVFELFVQAAELDVTVFVHTREWPSADRGIPLAAMQEIIACSASTGARSHLCHVSSKGLHDTPTILRAIAGARSRGVPVSVEVPSVAGATGRIGSALFSDGWTERWNSDYSSLEWPPTGERLTRETFHRLRAEQPMALVMKHITPESAVEAAMADPDVIVASDAVPVLSGHPGNPRAASTFSRVLGHYVRDRGLLSLPEAIRRMSLAPAQLIEHMSPDMRSKGRLAAGADADVVVFDPLVVAERANVQRPDEPPIGISDVLVAGQRVVADERLIPGTQPGRHVRGVNSQVLAAN